VLSRFKTWDLSIEDGRIGGGEWMRGNNSGEDRPVPIDRDCVLSVGVTPLRDGGLRHGKVIRTIGSTH
jgi:hypothetical protein